MKFKPALIALALAGSTMAGSAFAQTQGVSKNEIVIGTIQDLSGPVVVYSKPVVNGMKMRVDEINAEGGIHGRKLKLVIEDSGYDPKKAVLAQQKLIQRDKVFAMLGTLGTPVVGATMPLVLEKKLPHLFPLTGAAFTFEPVQPYKFQIFAPYVDTVRAGLRYLIKTKGLQKVGVLYQDDDFGLEVLRGAEAGAKDMGQQLCERTNYKRGATDFSSQIQRLRSAGCDFIVLGTIVRETIGAIATARKLAWNVEFFGSSAAYDTNIPKFGTKAVEGFYALSVQAEIPDYATANTRLKRWMDDYKKLFNEDSTLFSTGGYSIIDVFARAAQKAGPNLNADTLNTALENMTVPRDFFGSPEYGFSKTNHLGNKRGKVTQIQNGKWVTLTDYLD
jgi:ABC-type branched-subunit amino acid transport system substrate-binding protein